MTAGAKYQAAADVLDTWRDEVLAGKAPVIYPVGPADLERIEIGPGLVTLFGGAPGAGKTGLTMQLSVDAVRLTPTVRVLVCNVEMPLTALLDRQLARLSGIDLTTIRYRRLGAEHAHRIDQALNTLEAIADRLCFVRPPFDLSNVAASADASGANVILLDYIQRIAPPGDHGDRRGSVDATMSYLRQFADADVAVIVVSAVGRSRDRRGRNTYAAEGLNLASFRESSELEFGADDAFILTEGADKNSEQVVLRHLKSRHGETVDLHLTFDRQCQRFSGEPPIAQKPDNSALADLWDRTPAATSDDGDVT